MAMLVTLCWDDIITQTTRWEVVKICASPKRPFFFFPSTPLLMVPFCQWCVKTPPKSIVGQKLGGCGPPSPPRNYPLHWFLPKVFELTNHFFFFSTPLWQFQNLHKKLHKFMYLLYSCCWGKCCRLNYIVSIDFAVCLTQDM